MLVLFLSFAPAFADPPALPDWSQPDDRGGDDPDDGRVIHDTPAGAGVGSAASPADCRIGIEGASYTWSDASAGSVALAPRASDEEIWILVTGRLGSDVVAWRQGPYMSSGEVALQLPSELTSLSQARSRTGTLSARVITQDAFGNVLDSTALPRLTWTLSGAVGASPVLGNMADHEWRTDPTDSTLISADL